MGVRVVFLKGKWCIRVNHQGHRVTKAIGTSKDGATTVAKQVEVQLAMNDLGVFGIGDGKSDVFKVYADRWLTDGEGGRKATYHRWLKYNIAIHLNPTLGPRPIADIDRADARALVAALRKAKHKIHVVKAAVRVASGILSQAVDDGLRQANPFFRMGKHTRSADELVNDAEVRALSRDQVQRLITTVRDGWPEYAAFYFTAVRTGMRLGELLALKWSAIDFDAQSIDVRLNYTGGRFTTVKNKTRRKVDMSDQLAEVLKTHATAMKTRHWQFTADEKEEGRTAPANAPDLLFCAPDGTVWDGDNLRKRVHARLMTKAKLTGFTIHELRHTFASLLIFAGQPLAYVSKQLGHSSIQITVDTYGHLLPTADRSAVNVLDDAPAAKSKKKTGTR